MIMKFRLAATCLFAAALTLLLSGCLTRRTVTEGGRTVESKYMFKRPLKEAVNNSM
jgi:hypothetical protein